MWNVLQLQNATTVFTLLVKVSLSFSWCPCSVVVAHLKNSFLPPVAVVLVNAEVVLRRLLILLASHREERQAPQPLCVRLNSPVVNFNPRKLLDLPTATERGGDQRAPSAAAPPIIVFYLVALVLLAEQLPPVPPGLVQSIFNGQLAALHLVHDAQLHLVAQLQHKRFFYSFSCQ